MQTTKTQNMAGNKPQRFENVRFVLIWPDSAAQPVLETDTLNRAAYQTGGFR